ncbi:MAG: hypothetical protein H0U72_12170 [Nitrosospira sp.]|nr:hypothetical protein [Nitrosospira sp.]
MSDNAFRFLVANDAGEASQEWRVWTEGNELYVGPRSAAHEYKASFHSSGQCQVGISSEIRKSLVSEPAWTGKSRLFSTWTLDKVDIDSPRQDLLELLIPDSYLDVVKPEITPAGRILRGDPGQITSVALIRTHLSADAALTSTEPGFCELYRFQLDNAYTILVLQRCLTESLEYHKYVRSRFWSHYLAKPTPEGRTYRGKNVDQSSSSLRAMLWDGTQTRKYRHEVSARKLLALGPPEQ